MKVFDVQITEAVQDFFKEKLKLNTSLLDINNILKTVSGICNFLETENDFFELKTKIKNEYYLLNEPDRMEYGDFQTNPVLSLKITNYLSLNIEAPEVLIEPTCGRGNFIIAALTSFSSIKEIYGVEIYRPYVWETKFSILNFFLKNELNTKPNIVITNANVFEYNFKKIAENSKTKTVLILGNPPWVTNAMLGSLNSLNLPTKSNFKQHTGLEAITGKGNFDIAEYITLMLIEAFQASSGNLALLVKSSVIKNIIFDQSKNKYRINKLEKHWIDSKKEFNVSVDAALFFCSLNSDSTFNCETFDFYKSKILIQDFGWVNEKFVSDINKYKYSKQIDGLCQFEWRQGLKHDCSAVMELDMLNGQYSNPNEIGIELEEDLVYGILKSSDLKNTVIRSSRKYTIVTQTKVGQETSHIRNQYPKTYQYLIKNLSAFQSRKSSIYNNKPLFSIFGIGDYSFKPYKVVISGLYKTFHFSLVLPQNGKPLMLDDTCYMLSFDSLEFAVYTLILLNSQTTKDFLKSISFSEAKRTFTKDVLKRINLDALSKTFSMQELVVELDVFNTSNRLDIKITHWNNYLQEVNSTKNKQFEMFA